MIVCSFTPSRIGTICSILSNPAGGAVCCGWWADTTVFSEATIRNRIRLLIRVVIFQSPWSTPFTVLIHDQLGPDAVHAFVDSFPEASIPQRLLAQVADHGRIILRPEYSQPGCPVLPQYSRHPFFLKGCRMQEAGG